MVLREPIDIRVLAAAACSDRSAAATPATHRATISLSSEKNRERVEVRDLIRIVCFHDVVAVTEERRSAVAAARREEIASPSPAERSPSAPKRDHTDNTVSRRSVIAARKLRIWESPKCQRIAKRRKGIQRLKTPPMRP